MAPTFEPDLEADEPHDELDLDLASGLDLVLEDDVESYGKAELALQELTDRVTDIALQLLSPISFGPGILDVKYSLSIADPHLPDTPLVAISKGFTDLTGWRPSELLGRNCRFMNRGCEIDPETMAGLRRACKTGERFLAVLQNRKKDGTIFYNMFEVRGIRIGRATDGEERTLLIGLQADVTEFSAEEVRQGHAKRMSEVATMVCEELNAPFLKQTYAGCLEGLVDIYARPQFIEAGIADL